MNGNAWEWCLDCNHPYYNPGDGITYDNTVNNWLERYYDNDGTIDYPFRDPVYNKSIYIEEDTNMQMEAPRTIRGGSWADGAANFPLGYRNNYTPRNWDNRNSISFRVAISLRTL
jgi:formylglycine-generating enzyme required for sulfatase activity